MSGIFGIISRTEHKYKLDKDIQKMILWNRAYGRENEALYCDSTIALGCCCEKLSDDALQSSPVIKQDDYLAVADTLLYNAKELSNKCDLKKKISDEDLLLCSINQFGFDSLKDVNGDFSGAIYHEKEKTLTLFRDHMGIRPLFYYLDHNFVAFSTDIRGLLALDAVDSSINEDWIYRTCAGYYLDGLKTTEYKNIFCVNPASYTTFSFQDENIMIDEHIYWQPGSQKIKLSSFEEYKMCMRKLITDSVKRRLDAVSGVVGAELSGGLDSGIIDILIHRLGRKCLYHSWSVDPNQIPLAENDERIIIADICNQEGISCHYSDIWSDYSMNCTMAKTMLELGFSLNEEERPLLRYALPPYINTLNLTGTAGYMKKNGVRVIFSGHGGDEGVSHRCNPYELFYHHEYYHFFKQIWSSMQGQPRRVFRTVKKSYRILGSTRRQLTSPFREAVSVPEILNKGFAAKFHEKDMPRMHFAYSPIEYIKEGGSRSRLDNIALQGAYNGVRYVVPYLDYRVIDFAVSIPRHLYLSGTMNRYIFREAFKDMIPDSLYHLKCKMDNSITNFPSNPNWFEGFARKRDEIYQKLDREFWEPYLDFNFIDAWVKKETLSEEEKEDNYNVLMCLFYFAMAQNIIEKSII